MCFRPNSSFWRLIGFTLLPLVSVGCSSTHPLPSPGEGMYGPDDVSQFVEDTSTPMHAQIDPEYIIGMGDKLDVVFLFHNNLTTRDLLVRRDGRISLPYVGDQMAAGVTPMMLDSVLTVHFSDILRDPNLSVIIRTPAPQKVYVLGEVNAPGGFKFDSELTVLQSIAEAGGLKKGAKAEQAILIRRQGMSKIVGIEIDMKAIMAGKSIQNDLRLRNFDIVYIPQSRLYSTAEFFKVVGGIIEVPLEAVLKGWQIANLAANYEFFRNATQSTSSP